MVGGTGRADRPVLWDPVCPIESSPTGAETADGRIRGVDLSARPAGLVRATGRPKRPGDTDRARRGGSGWADIGGGFNLNVRIDAEPPVVLRVHRPGSAVDGSPDCDGCVNGSGDPGSGSLDRCGPSAAMS